MDSTSIWDEDEPEPGMDADDTTGDGGNTMDDNESNSDGSEITRSKRTQKPKAMKKTGTIEQKKRADDASKVGTGSGRLQTFTCKYCGNSYRWLENLKRHIRNHENDKPYECDRCGSKFRLYDVLMRHYRIHTGEKPFKCRQCDRRFRDKSNLSQHIQSHVTGRNFICEVCARAYKNKRNLKNHSCKVPKTENSNAIPSPPGLVQGNDTKQSPTTSGSNGATISYQFSSKGMEIINEDHIKKEPQINGDGVNTENSHSTQRQPISLSPLVKEVKGHLCPVCSKWIRSFSGLKLHITRLHPQNDYDDYFANKTLSKPVFSIKPQDTKPDITEVLPWVPDEADKIDKNSVHWQMYNGEKCPENALKVAEYSQKIIDSKGDEVNIEMKSVSYFQCKICEFAVRSVSGLKSHYKRMHKVVYAKKPDQSSGDESGESNMENTGCKSKRLYVCPYCSKVLSTKRGLSQHATKVHHLKLEKDASHYKIKQNKNKENVGTDVTSVKQETVTELPIHYENQQSSQSEERYNPAMQTMSYLEELNDADVKCSAYINAQPIHYDDYSQSADSTNVGIQSHFANSDMQVDSVQHGTQLVYTQPGITQESTQFDMRYMQPGMQVQFAQPGMQVHYTQPGMQLQSTQPGMQVQSTQPGMHIKSTQSGTNVQKEQPGIQGQSTQPGDQVKSTMPGIQLQNTQPFTQGQHTQPGIQGQYTQLGTQVQFTQPGMQLQSAQPGIQLQTSQPGMQLQSAQPGIQLQTSQPGMQLQSAQPGIQLQTSQPGMQLQSTQPCIQLQSTQPGMQLQSAQPGIQLQSTQPIMQVQSTPSGIQVQSTQSGIQVQPSMQVQTTQSGIQVKSTKPGMQVQFTQPGIQLQNTQSGTQEQYTQPGMQVQTTQPGIQLQNTQPGMQVQNTHTEEDSTHTNKQEETIGLEHRNTWSQLLDNRNNNSKPRMQMQGNKLSKEELLRTMTEDSSMLEKMTSYYNAMNNILIDKISNVIDPSNNNSNKVKIASAMNMQQSDCDINNSTALQPSDPQDANNTDNMLTILTSVQKGDRNIDTILKLPSSVRKGDRNIDNMSTISTCGQQGSCNIIEPSVFQTSRNGDNTTKIPSNGQQSVQNTDKGLRTFNSKSLRKYLIECRGYYACQCGCLFKDRMSVSIHRRMHHYENLLQCAFCEDEFESLLELFRHFISHDK